MLVRRIAATAIIAVALAASFDSEFPATASGQVPAAQVSGARGT